MLPQNYANDRIYNWKIEFLVYCKEITKHLIITHTHTNTQQNPLIHFMQAYLTHARIHHPHTHTQTFANLCRRHSNFKQKLKQTKRNRMSL